jgi:hypothetical protein
MAIKICLVSFPCDANSEPNGCKREDRQPTGKLTSASDRKPEIYKTEVCASTAITRYDNAVRVETGYGLHDRGIGVGVPVV